MVKSIACTALWLAALVAGCGNNAGGTAGSGGAGGSNDEARAQFQTLCAACHGPEGKPTEAMVARLAVRDLTSAEFRARVTPALVEHQVHAGSKNKLMPSFDGVVDDAKIKAIAAYVASPTFPGP
ncbi:MAG TPA: cytochrome c [Kofleriaceae bacterium]